MARVSSLVIEAQVMYSFTYIAHCFETRTFPVLIIMTDLSKDHDAASAPREMENAFMI